MSEQLAFSSGVSVLMMALYVLFGADAQGIDAGAGLAAYDRVPAALSLPSTVIAPGYASLLR